MPGKVRTRWLSVAQPWLLLGLLLAVPLHGVPADEALQRRVLVGVKLFPSVLAASQSLESESAMHHVRVFIVYRDDENSAWELAETLRNIEAIKGIPLVVETLPIALLPLYSSDPPFGLFIAQRNDKDVELITHFGRQHNVITFSPFRGDVEKGILAGIEISDRILPYINSETLAALPVGLKAFFLKVAEIYEP